MSRNYSLIVEWVEIAVLAVIVLLLDIMLAHSIYQRQASTIQVVPAQQRNTLKIPIQET